MIPRKRSVGLALPKNAGTRANEIFVEHALVKRTKPPSAVNRLQCVPAARHSLEPVTLFLGCADEAVLQCSATNSPDLLLCYILQCYPVIAVEVVVQRHRLIHITGGSRDRFYKYIRSVPASIRMQYPEHALAVLASTLAGGIDQNRTRMDGNQTCQVGTDWHECKDLDKTISPRDIALPWVFTVGTLLCLSMPTLLLRSKNKEKGLRYVAWMFVQTLSLLTMSLFLSDHPSIKYALTMHSCARLLTRLELSSSLVGGAWWWRLRFMALSQLFVWQIFQGPAVSVIQWDRALQVQTMPCTYLAHLGGCLFPDLILFALSLMAAAGNCVSVHGE
jgi:hypothetical protein